MLDFRLYTFLTLSYTLNYTKAAKELSITQPAVTQHIQFLEAQYGCALFAHEGKRLVLTKQGEVLQRSVQRIAADEKKVMEQLRKKEETGRKLVFGASLTIGEFLLPQRLNSYLIKHPDCRLCMHVENTEILTEMVQKGTVDFAFVEGYFKKKDFYHQLLSKERYVAVCSSRYPVKGNKDTLEELLKERLIVREKGSGTREILDRLLKERNLSIDDFSSVIEIGNLHAIKQMVKSCMGITFLYEAAVREELESGEFCVLARKELQIQREFRFICLEDSLYKEEYLRFFQEICAAGSKEKVSM